MSLSGVDCIGYSRVSTERQAGETQSSPDDQRAAILGLSATLRRTVGAWYADLGVSGATVEQRPGLRQLLADCQASPRSLSAPGYVLVLNDSRWGRFPDPEDATFWRILLKHCGWLVRFVEGDDIGDGTARSVMRIVGSAQASEYRANVQRNAKRGSRGTAAQGFWGSRTPYGYRRKVVYPPGRERVLGARQRKAPDEKVMLTPEPSEAEVVRTLFTRYAQGTETLASMTSWLLDTTARKWTSAAVRFTLSNPAYVGDVISGRVPSDKAERAQTPRRSETEWVTTPNAHPALVSRALFAAAQDVLARNRKWTSRVRTDWLLSGLVTCPCGQPYVAGGTNANRRTITRSYRCVTKAGLQRNRCAFPGGVKKEWLEGAVVDTVAAVVGAPAQRRRLLQHLDHTLAQLRNAPDTALASLVAEIATATSTRDRLVAAVADGTLVGDEAKDRLTAVRRLLGRLEGQRDALVRATANTEALDAERDRLALRLLDFRAQAKALSGPALRELIRPWIAAATFDPRARTLSLDIRHVPAHAYGDLTQMRSHPTQEHSSTGHVTRRTVVVGAPR